MAMEIEKILSCICVLVILMSVVPGTVFALDSGTKNASGKYNSFQDSNEKVSSMHGQEVKFIGTAIEYHEGSVMPGDLPRWKVSVDEIISGPSEIKGHTVFVAIGTATIEPGYMDPNIKSGDIVKVYGIYREVDNVWLEGSNYYLKKVSSECLSISVWADKSEYKIGETVTIYYQTNTACTAKLTVTKPDGTQVVVGGPNDIPVCTRSKSSTAGYPTGTRTVTFEAWTSDESKKATCYFDVVEEKKSGSLTVTIYPSEVRTDARWKLTSGPDTNWHYNGDTITNIPVGSYTIQFKDVSGWNKPSDKAVTITEGSNSQSGTYTQKAAKKVKFRGKILVDYYWFSYHSLDIKIDKVLDDPTGNLQEGETVNVYGHRDGPAQVDNVTVGDEVEIFGEYRGYVGTYEQIFLSDYGESSSDHYVKKIDGQKVGSLTVMINPSEVRSEARWKLTTETSWHSSGDTITNIPVGSCTIQFKDISGWTKPSDKTVTINEDFNYRSGTYTKETGSLTVTIYPSDVQSNARWKLTTETSWHSSGDTITNIPVGSCTIEFKDVSGWTKPSDKTVTITEGPNSESGTYTKKSGSLTVTIYPSEVRSTARWKLTSGDDTSWHSSGDTIYSISVGSYTIRFKDVSGWNKPSDKGVTITEGPNSESGTYTKKSGTLTVTIYPSDVQSNGRWKLTSGDDTSWHFSGEPIYSIPVGSYTIQFKDVSGWTKPSDKTVTITEGSNSESGTYTKKSGSLTVTIYPSDVRSNARWKLTSGDDTSWHSSGDTISSIPVGSYIIRFKDVSGWNMPSDKGVTITEGSNSESGTYTQETGSLTVTIYPSKVRSNARWKLTTGLDTKWHTSGHKISNIPIGPYLIRFNDVSGWTKPYDTTITIKEGVKSNKYSTYKEQTVNYQNLAKAARFRAKTMEALWLYYLAEGDEDKLTKKVNNIIDEKVVEGFKVFRESIQQDPKSGNPLIDGCIELGSLLSICDQATAGETPHEKMVDIIVEMGSLTVDEIEKNGAARALKKADVVDVYRKPCELRNFIDWCNKEAEAWESGDKEQVKRALEKEAYHLGRIDGALHGHTMCRKYYHKVGILKELTYWATSADHKANRKTTEMLQIMRLYSECGGDTIELHDQWVEGYRSSCGYAKCPVNLHAYDSFGRHVGVNESGGVDLEIPGAYYSGIDSHPQIIQIFGTNDFYFVVEALDQGEFNLTTESSTYEETTTVQYEHIAIENDTTAIINLSKVGYTIDIDKDGDNNIDYTVDPTTVETNHPPEVSIMAIADDVIFKDDISISYTLKDIDIDVCNISARYSTDQMIWHDATIGSGGDGTIGLSSSADGVTHTYVWASGVDLPDVSSVVYFEIRPNDGMADGIRGMSNAFYVGEVTASFTYSPSSPSVNKNIVFAAYASIGNITNYTWDFDDGTITSTDAPTIMHSYDSAGDYSINLTVTDRHGASNTINKAITVCPLGEDNYSLQLNTGWNLISLPLMPDDTDVLDVMNSLAGNWNSVWSYETGNWKRYDLTGPDFLNDLTTIEPGKGYWLNMKSDDTLSLSGSEPTTKSISLSAGWNLVSYNSLNSKSTTEAMNSVTGNWNSIWSYEAGIWKRYDLTGPDFLNDLTSLEPGKGYWIDMKSSDTWTLGA